MSQQFEFEKTSLPGLFVISRKLQMDNRGSFQRIFCDKDFEELGFSGKKIVQVNHSTTLKRHSVRGLHFQYPPHCEDKIVSCVNGEVLDIAVDVRRDSATFLKWHTEILSSENNKSLYIPAGFAHGFQTLTDNCELLYLHTAYYEPSAEGALNIKDPALNISLPEPISDISERDREHPMLDNSFTGVSL